VIYLTAQFSEVLICYTWHQATDQHSVVIFAGHVQYPSLTWTTRWHKWYSTFTSHLHPIASLTLTNFSQYNFCSSDSNVFTALHTIFITVLIRPSELCLLMSLWLHNCAQLLCGTGYSKSLLVYKHLLSLWFKKQLGQMVYIATVLSLFFLPTWNLHV
jgi:hypothetical protein